MTQTLFIGKKSTVDFIKNTHFDEKLAEEYEFYFYSNRASESLVQGKIEDSLMFDLEYAIMHFKDLPVEQRKQWRRLKNAQIEVGSELWMNFFLDHFEEAVDEYCKARRMVPVVWELHTLLLNVWCGRISETKLRFVRKCLKKSDTRIMSLGADNRKTRRQILLHLLISLFQYAPRVNKDKLKWFNLFSTAEQELSQMWEFAEKIQLSEMLSNATRAMIGLTAHDLLLLIGDNDKYVDKAISLCNLAIRLLEGDIMIEEEIIGNLYLIGAYYYDLKGNKDACIEYLQRAIQYVDEKRLKKLHVLDTIQAIKKTIDKKEADQNALSALFFDDCKESADIFFPRKKLLN